MNRNVDDHFAKTPTPHFPRSRFDMGIHKRLQTQGHGRLYPFFARVVYPGDTWKMDMSAFVRMDTSFRVPLDDIYLDTYFFFVPFRIIDDNFRKVLGEVEPYDDDEYSIPQLEIGEDANLRLGLNCLLPYMGYSQSDIQYYAAAGGVPAGFHPENPDEFTAYPFAAYYKIYNDWFRDENVDPSIPYDDIYGANLYTLLNGDTDGLFDGFDCLKVNRYHDYFSSALISPQKGPAVTIPLGLSAPVGSVVPTGQSLATGLQPDIFYNNDETESAGTFVQVMDNDLGQAGFIADLSKAAGTINELRLAFAIQSLYERRGRFGTRYIETIRGQWGIEVPDSFFQRPEYLGGSRVTLNNVPVLSTENSSQLGQMAGNSATLTGGNSWTKTFIEYGIIIGVSCTRIKHSYTQGKRKELFGLKTALDLYNPVFANIGYTAINTDEIWNDSTAVGSVFAYQEAWADLRCDVDTFAGLFGMWSTNSEIKNKWHYGDYYSAKPTFSASWLKEDYKNIARTLTGQLITGASSTESEGHQFMFAYYYHPVVTRILPAHSVPVELIGRL